VSHFVSSLVIFCSVFFFLCRCYGVIMCLLYRCFSFCFHIFSCFSFSSCPPSFAFCCCFNFVFCFLYRFFPSLCCTGCTFPQIKRQRREDDHSPPSSAEVSNVGSYTSSPAYAYMAWCCTSVTVCLFYCFCYVYTFLVPRLEMLRAIL